MAFFQEDLYLVWYSAYISGDTWACICGIICNTLHRTSTHNIMGSVDTENNMYLRCHLLILYNVNDMALYRVNGIDFFPYLNAL